MGGGVDMGIEERRAYGGAVRFWAGAGRAAVVMSVGIGLIVISFGCSRQTVETAPDPALQLQTVPAADTARLGSLEESKHWSNPYLVIRTEKVGLLTGVAANEEQILKPEEVMKTLARLPNSAWPYGRAVAILVDEKTTSTEQDKVALRRNRGIVAGELESAHVAIRWIPSS
jgi:hypothetical protein